MKEKPKIRVYKDNKHIGSINWEHGTDILSKHKQIIKEFGDYDFYSYENRNNEWNNDMLYSFSYIDFTYFYYDTNLHTKSKILPIQPFKLNL